MTKLACPRETYGKCLVKQADKDERIVALDADLSGSTILPAAADITERYLRMGIANRHDVCGRRLLQRQDPFVHSFSMFLTGRAFEQVRQSVALPKANVKLIGSSYGFSDFGDGATHQALEDVAVMRVLPNMTVLVPMDTGEVEEAVELALEINGPVYIRISRSPMEDIPKELPGSNLLEPALVADGRDLVVFANGLMTKTALEARGVLAGEGISLRGQRHLREAPGQRKHPAVGSRCPGRDHHRRTQRDRRLGKCDPGSPRPHPQADLSHRSAGCLRPVWTEPRGAARALRPDQRGHLRAGQAARWKEAIV